MNKLNLVENKIDIRNSLDTFNKQAPYHQARFRKIIRNPNQKNWVYDSRSRMFGPSKFVGYINMDFALYEWALSKECEEAFQGSDTKRAIENALGQFAANSKLSRELLKWAELIYSGVTENITVPQWQFVTLS